MHARFAPTRQDHPAKSNRQADSFSHLVWEAGGGAVSIRWDECGMRLQNDREKVMLRRNTVGLFLAILFATSEAGTANAQSFFHDLGDVDLPSFCSSSRYSAFDPIYACQRACGQNPG